MMRPLLLASALILAAGAAQAAGPKPPKQIVDAVTASMAEEEEAGAPQPAMFSQVDINRDGRPDWKVDYGLSPNASMWCGTGGCNIELWASQPGGGWSKVMDELVRGLEITHPGGGTRLDLQFHGTACGAGGAYDCRRGYLWDENVGWVAVANDAGKTWLYNGPVELNLYDRNDVPAEVTATYARFQAACPPGGGSAEIQTWGAQRIPDINGDGRTDWVVGGSYQSCASGREDERVPMTVLVSQPDGSLKEAFSRKNATFGLDIGATPAAIYVIPMGSTCGGEEDEQFDKPCGTRLRWDGRSGKLIE